MRICWDFFAILLKPNAMPAVQTYLLNLWIWPEYTHKKKTLNWGAFSESMPEPSQSIVKFLLGDQKNLSELGTTLCVECHKQWQGCHFQELTLYTSSHCVKSTAVAAVDWQCSTLWSSSLIMVAHLSHHGLCALTWFLHADLKAGKARNKTYISRRREHDPNYFNTSTHAVIPGLNSKHKKADGPEPKSMLPALWEL